MTYPRDPVRAAYHASLAREFFHALLSGAAVIALMVALPGRWGVVPVVIWLVVMGRLEHNRRHHSARIRAASHPYEKQNT